ncbi:MAG: hypothetical protein OFPI_40640 [Osedax symbiont Rs2]|nr:MAG: hypothetical protein OFPI_40640 [Osedax symbiont Rs2]
MNKLKYLKFNQVNINDFMSLLNQQKIREHLIEHPLFDLDTVSSWMNAKTALDSIQGCIVRAIYAGGTLAGWCAIQLEDGKYEIAIVLDHDFWGMGKRVFSQMICWAKEFGHDEVYIHFLHTRPPYKFLRRVAKNVYETEIFGNKFTTYQLTVSSALKFN